MSKRKTVFDKLTVAERRHLADGSVTGRASVRSLVENLQHQDNIGGVCWECRRIARKLGVAIPDTNAAPHAQPGI